MNKNIWNLYKDSDRGKETISLFNLNIDNANPEAKTKEFFQRFNEYLGGNEADFLSHCFIIYDCIVFNTLFIEEHENPSEFFIRLIDNLEIFFTEENSNGELIRVGNERPLIAKKNYKAFCSLLPEISTVLYIFGDLFFSPIFFREQFDVFMKVLDILDIPMPELPAKSDKRGRLLLYNELNKNITEFAEEHNLTRDFSYFSG